MLQVIGLLKSGTMRGLIVAAIAYLISLSGLSDQFPDSEKYLDGALKIAEAGGLLFAGWARTFRPNPPLTQKAVEKRVELVAEGKLKEMTASQEASVKERVSRDSDR